MVALPEVFGLFSTKRSNFAVTVCIKVALLDMIYDGLSILNSG